MSFSREFALSALGQRGTYQVIFICECLHEYAYEADVQHETIENGKFCFALHNLLRATWYLVVDAD